MSIKSMRALAIVACGAFTATGAAASEAHFTEGLVHGCVASAVAPLWAPVALYETHYWKLDHGPDTGEFRLVRGDASVFIDAFDTARCLVGDLRMSDAEVIAATEAALEARFPGAWTREDGTAGPGWLVGVDGKLLKFTLVTGLGGGSGVAMTLGS